MIVMTKLKNVLLRGNIYHFRMMVPADLQECYGRTTHTQSLKTADPLDASKKADVLTAKYKNEHQKLREAIKIGTSVATPQPKQTNGPFFDLSFFEHELRHLHGDLTELRKGALDQLYSCSESAINLLKDISKSNLSVEDLDQPFLDPLSPQTILELCMQAIGGQDLSDGPLRRKTARFVIPRARAILKDLINEIAPLIGDRVVYTAPQQVNEQWLKALIANPSSALALPKTSASEDAGTLLLSSALEKYIDQKDLTENTVEAIRAGVGLFLNWAGDKAISQYSIDDLVDYRNNCLRKLPKNHNKKKEYQPMPLRQVVIVGFDDEHISSLTVNNLLSKVHTVFSYALKRQWISINPASDLKDSKPKKSLKIDRSYSDGELKNLFEVLQYDEKNPSRYWMPLIALYNSFRSNEICQLYISDIVKVGGFHCFDINENNKAVTKKRVKNHASCRIVPIHPTLINAGFLEYVQKRKQDLKSKNGLLFPDVTYSEKAGHAKSTGRWFNYTLKPKFISADNTTQRGVHSLRHSFGRYAKNRAKMNPNAERVLMGHASDKGAEIHDGYTVEEVQFLYDELKKLDYGLEIPANPFIN